MTARSREPCRPRPSDRSPGRRARRARPGTPDRPRRAGAGRRTCRTSVQVSRVRPVTRRGGAGPLGRCRSRPRTGARCTELSGARLASATVPAPPPAPAPQLSFDELGTPLRDVTFVVLDLETTGGSAERDTHHRGRGGQGARRRAGRRAGHARRPRHRHPAAGRRPHRASRPRSSPARRGCRRCCRRSSSSSPAASWWPTTHRSTPVSCAPRASATASPGRARPCCAPPVSPAPC